MRQKNKWSVCQLLVVLASLQSTGTSEIRGKNTNQISIYYNKKKSNREGLGTGMGVLGHRLLGAVSCCGLIGWGMADSRSWLGGGGCWGRALDGPPGRGHAHAEAGGEHWLGASQRRYHCSLSYPL
jgi:hypothetical protein